MAVNINPELDLSDEHSSSGEEEEQMSRSFEIDERNEVLPEGTVMECLGVVTKHLIPPGFYKKYWFTNQADINMLTNYVYQISNLLISIFPDSKNYSNEYAVATQVIHVHRGNNRMDCLTISRQRCRIISNSFDIASTNRVKRITIKCLPELHINAPLENKELPLLNVSRRCNQQNFNCIMKNCKHQRYQMAQYPINNSWVYNNIYTYIFWISRRLERFFLLQDIPGAPVKLSYWILTNFLLSHTEKLQIIKVNSLWERLRLELYCLKMERIICCRSCNAKIAHHDDILKYGLPDICSHRRDIYIYHSVSVLQVKNVTECQIPLIRRPRSSICHVISVIICETCEKYLGIHHRSSTTAQFKNGRTSSFYQLFVYAISPMIVDE